MKPEAVVWGYRLFLDREPENDAVVADKSRSLSSSQELRREFLQSDEFKAKNPRAGFLAPFSGNEPPMDIDVVYDLQELFFHTKDVWEHLGETEPYWSVLALERFKHSEIQETRSEFYESGRDNVITFFRTLERNKIDFSSFRRCLEYGCGLGRVTRYLAERFEKVFGYDISKPHLQLAEEYLVNEGIKNVSLHHISKPSDIKNLPKVDAVYSVIVLQHNPPSIISFIVREMMRALNPGGIAFFQVPTYREGYRFSLQEYINSEATKREMEMHVLPQSTVFEIVGEEGGRLIEVFEDGWTGSGHGGRSNTFLIQKM